jgi:hypothetical protein
MKRAQAFALVRTRGGVPRSTVTKQTVVLIVGQLGWPRLADGRSTSSLAQARSYGVPIASERQFLEWIGRLVPSPQVKSYTPAELVALSKLPPEVVDQLAMFGLIEPRGGLYGFSDLAAARQIARLLVSGIALSRIIRSLIEIQRWLPDAGLSNLRIFPESSDRILIEQSFGRTDATGQFVLPIDGQGGNPDLLFAQAQAHEDANETAAAERLYRRVMMMDPTNAVAAFKVGNLLRLAGRKIEAQAAFWTSLKADPTFAQAWYNLADLLEDEGRSAAAIEHLRRAIAADQAYADPVFNLALLLQKLGYHSEAAIWWRRYLELDGVSLWSVRARRALKWCELQSVGSSEVTLAGEKPERPGAKGG